MVQPDKISWGKYNGYEGPFYRGSCPYKLPDNPTEADKIIAVITATEGGRFDAYNGYDRMICTSGLIQWGEAGQHSVSNMLGELLVNERQSVEQWIDKNDIRFKTNAKGQWRFFFLDHRGEVNTLQEQQQLFLLNSTGKSGTWDKESTEYAKQWAAAISTVWENPAAQRAQLQYTVHRLNGFLLPYAYSEFKQIPDISIGHAFKAAYLSFAANNPTWANNQLKIANDTAKDEKWTLPWLVYVLRQLTFGPRVVIYPHRYNAIRPVLERLYKVDLPDFAQELEQWKDKQPHEFFYDTKQIQEALITLGFDLGPAKADGVYGEKTKAAVRQFEQLVYHEIDPQISNIPEQCVDGMVDNYTAKKLEAVLEARGIKVLT